MPTRIENDAEPSSSSSLSSSIIASGDQAGPSNSRSTLPHILPLSAFPDPGTPLHSKPSGYEFYRNVLKSPKHIVAPMVSGSELPWRTLSRRYGADLCYSPMINCRSLVDALHGKGKSSRVKSLEWFNVETGEEGHGEDEMLIVQLAGDDPDVILEAAEYVQDHCLAVDLNLGCPQHIAKRGHYGSYLQEEWPLIFRIINTLHLNLRIPVTAKMRVLEDTEATVAYAKILQHAGAQIVTVHGRTREQKGHKTGVADWQKIRAVKEALDVPVFANGNILYGEDLQNALEKTGADGVMSAEGSLYNPMIFSSKGLRNQFPAEFFPHREDGVEPQVQWAQFPYIPAIANAYLDEVVRFRTKTEHGAVKGHMFKICRPALEKHTDVRALVGKAQLVYQDAPKEAGDEELSREVVIKDYREAIKLLDEKLMADRQDPKYASSSITSSSSSSSSSSSLPQTETRYIPHWLCQPYFRPPLPQQNPAEAKQTPLSIKKNDILAKRAAANLAKEDSIPGGMVEINDVQSAGEKRALETSQEQEATGADEAEAEAEAPPLAAEAGRSETKRICDLRLSLQSSMDLKSQANGLFERRLYEEAVASYMDAIAALPVRVVEGEDEDEEGEGDGEGDDGTSEGREEKEEEEGAELSWVDQLPSSSSSPHLPRLDKREKKKKITEDVALSTSQGSTGAIVELTDEEARALQTTSHPPANEVDLINDPEEEEERRHLEKEIVDLRTICYSNCAAAYLKLERYQEARETCDQALLDTPKHLKSLHRKSQALKNLLSNLEVDRTSKEESSSSSSSSTSTSTSTTTTTRIRTKIDLLTEYISLLHTLLAHPSLACTSAQHVELSRLLLPQAQRELEACREREKEEMLGKLKDVGDRFLGWFGLSTANFQMRQGEGGAWGVTFQK